MSASSGGHCPLCGAKMRVRDSRDSKVEHVICRRIRICECGYTCRTHEVIVVDSEGFSNAQALKARKLLSRIQDAVYELYGDDLRAELRTRINTGGQSPDQTLPPGSPPKEE